MGKVFFLIMVLSLASAGNVYAQAADMPQADIQEAWLEDIQEAYGEVVLVDATAGNIVISEYDYEKDEDVNKTYKIDRMATYENVKRLADIKVGDWIALTLKPQKGKKSDLVVSIYVERYDFGEEEIEAPAETPVEAMAVEIE